MTTVAELQCNYHAAARRALAQAQKRHEGRWMTTRSKFSSTCAQCKTAISVGVAIVSPNSGRNWYCVTCGEELWNLDRPTMHDGHACVDMSALRSTHKHLIEPFVAFVAWCASFGGGQ